MLKLTKYEFRKNLTALLVLLGGLAALEIWFLVSVHLDKEGSMIGSAVVLFLYALVCFFAVFLFAVVNYYREINSKTSYLVFMTPVSPLKIVLSKMLSVLITGTILGGLLIFLGVSDINLLSGHVEDFQAIQDAMNEVFRSFGYLSGRLLFNLVFNVISFLLAFFAQVAMVYFCITLTATLLQNSRFRMLVSVVLYVLLSWLRGFIQGKIGEAFPVQDMVMEVNFQDVMYQMTPYTILNLVSIVILLGATTWLLAKKLSL